MDDSSDRNAGVLGVAVVIVAFLLLASVVVLIGTSAVSFRMQENRHRWHFSYPAEQP